ncbi:MAG: hypothetical protein FWC64_00490 [Treponema sp.]|nr:hypothetical protein [Treponema sp.]
MKKKMSIFVVAAVTAALALVIAACPLEFTGSEERNEIPWGHAAFSDTLAGRSWGYITWVDVEVTFVNGIIDDVNIRHNESRDHGAVLINRAIPLIVQANYFEIDIITRSSMVRTADALIDSWRDILAQLPSE